MTNTTTTQTANQIIFNFLKPTLPQDKPDLYAESVEYIRDNFVESSFVTVQNPGEDKLLLAFNKNNLLSSECKQIVINIEDTIKKIEFDIDSMVESEKEDVQRFEKFAKGFTPNNTQEEDGDDNFFNFNLPHIDEYVESQDKLKDLHEVLDFLNKYEFNIF